MHFKTDVLSSAKQTRAHITFQLLFPSYEIFYYLKLGVEYLRWIQDFSKGVGVPDLDKGD